MKVAVTGAGGLLGQAVVNRLRISGHEVLALSRTGAGSGGIWRAEQGWEETVPAIRGAQVVVHAAARIPIEQANPDEARKCFEINALGTLNLLRASERVGIQRFILVSGANVLRPQTRPVCEDDPIGCEHAPYYLGSKVLAEIFTRSFAAGDMQRLIVRPSAIYGPCMKGGALRMIADRLSERVPVTLRDGGRYQADFVWRDDVAAVIAASVASTRTGTVNLGSGEAYSLLTVAKMMAEMLEADAALVQVEASAESAGIIGFSAVDISRAKQWFDYRPTSLPQGLRLWLHRGG